MPALLLIAWGWVKPYALYALLGLAVLGTVLAVLARTKRVGVLQERTETAIAAAVNVQRQEKARAAAPHTASDTVDALDKGTF